MTLKGNAYPRTAWAYEERPVASSKLNLWDERIEAALELIFLLLSQAWGGGNGVLRGITADNLHVAVKTPSRMAVEVHPGYAFISKAPCKLGQTETLELLAPVTHPRIDLVQARLDTWNVGIKMGNEAATPAVPVVDTDCLVLAEVFMRPGMTCINAVDDGINGYLTDRRVFV